MKSITMHGNMNVKLDHGCPTRGPSACILGPAATFLNHECTIQITR